MSSNFIFVLLAIMILTSYAQGYKLKQVLILSRHNIRTPLVQDLQCLSPYEFPKWDEDPGLLTDKGVLLEEYMGEYFQKWIADQKLFPDTCPGDDDVLIYANTRQRTRESAKSFARTAFRDCNVTVFSLQSESMDPVFNPIIHNTSTEIKAAIVNEIQKKICELKLQESYAELNKIADLKHSNACKKGKLCDFNEGHDDVVYEVGSEPDINGSLHLGNALVDSFLMSYYEGMPLEHVAWGRITAEDQWKLLTEITKENQHVRFNSTVLAKEVARPLLTYILGLFERNNPPKFTLLVGHDSNLTPVISSLGFIPYDLPGQFERTPVGGKLVFQKIEDDSGKVFAKFDFVYQSFEHIRIGATLSLRYPPLWYPMQIMGCSDENLYCPWENFIDVMKNVVDN